MKVINKYARTTSLRAFWCLYCKLWTDFTPWFDVSIVDFEDIHAILVRDVPWKYFEIFLNFNNINRNKCLQNSSNIHFKELIFEDIGLQHPTRWIVFQYFFSMILSIFQNDHFKKPLQTVTSTTVYMKKEYTEYMKEEFGETANLFWGLKKMFS